MTRRLSRNDHRRERRALDILGVLALCFSGVVLAGCTTTSTEPREFVVGLDSISTPLQTRFDEGLSVRLWGPVGPNGCYRFKRADVTKDSVRATVTVVGEQTRSTGTDCSAMPVALRGDSIVLVPPFRDPFEVRVLRRDGQWITHSVRILDL